MPVNRPQPAPPPAAAPASADARLYLRDQELNESAALIRAASRKLAALVEMAGAGSDLSGPELDILQEVFDAGPMDVSELRARIGAPKQSLARNLNQLEARNLVTRETDARDRRRRLVTLTAEGHVFTRDATERRRIALRQAFVSGGPDAVSGLRRVLAEILRVRSDM
jgi:DNA-binding MarR family transcriptional regulator